MKLLEFKGENEQPVFVNTHQITYVQIANGHWCSINFPHGFVTVEGKIEDVVTAIRLHERKG